MDYPELLRKRDAYQEGKHLIPELTIASYERAFEIEYTHHSTAIEGNTLTLMETKLVLEDRLSVGGKRLRELYETINHEKAFHYVKDCIGKGYALDEKIVKDIHAMLMQNIMVGGVYRNVDVYISGAQHTPPSPDEMYRQAKDFYADLGWKGQQLNLIELAAWTHAEFVKIHPYPDAHVIIGTRLEKPSKINGFALLSPIFLSHAGWREDGAVHINTYYTESQMGLCA